MHLVAIRNPWRQTTTPLDYRPNLDNRYAVCVSLAIFNV